MELLPRYQEAVKFVFLEEVEIPEIQAKVQQLTADSQVLFTILACLTLFVLFLLRKVVKHKRSEG